MTVPTTTELQAVLDEAMAGERLPKAERRALSKRLSAICESVPPGTGPLSGLSRDLKAAADILAT
jgi:uncharacterized membrane protein